VTGTVYSVPPIPPDPEHTTWVPAGGLSIGVEYRLLDEAEIEANYAGRELDEIRAAVQDRVLQDNGVSIHVAGAHDGHEYLRFDLFEQDPHYHYIEPSGERQTIVQYDRVAMGDMLAWTLHQLRHRLAPMLERAGGAELLAKLDRAGIDSGLARVEDLARRAAGELARGRHAG
jgi:hypothetical protein